MIDRQQCLWCGRVYHGYPKFRSAPYCHELCRLRHNDTKQKIEEDERRGICTWCGGVNTHLVWCDPIPERD